jgi:hypothetical protein
LPSSASLFYFSCHTTNAHNATPRSLSLIFHILHSQQQHRLAIHSPGSAQLFFSRRRAAEIVLSKADVINEFIEVDAIDMSIRKTHLSLSELDQRLNSSDLLAAELENHCAVPQCPFVKIVLAIQLLEKIIASTKLQLPVNLFFYSGRFNTFQALPGKFLHSMILLRHKEINFILDNNFH